MKLPRKCSVCDGYGHKASVCERLPVVRMKMCSACKKEKRIPHDFRTNRSRADGYQSHCKQCFKERYRSYSPEERRKQHVRVFYGLSWESYVQMLAAQGHTCAICRKPIEALVSDRLTTAHVDHDHVTHQVRGMLCHNCNSGLGYFQDDPKLLIEAAEYLARARRPKVA